MKKNKSQTVNLRRGLLASAVMAGMGLSTAQALEVDTGNPDWAVRFDNTIKLNYAQRVESPNSKLANAWNNNDGNRNFSSGSAVSQRIDVLTEMDVVFRENMGFRVSANTWYDHAYDNVGAANSSTNQLVNSGQTVTVGPFTSPVYYQDPSHKSGYAQRYYNGVSSEILDAFVFGSTEVGDESLLSAKLGSTTNYWGESVLSLTHGINYGQSGLDIAKALAVPGTEAKELFIPREQFYTSFNLNSEWTFAGQYFFGWDAALLPESGTYLGFNDGIQNGGHNNYLILGTTAALGVPDGFAYAQNGHTFTPENSGDWGLMARWAPEWLDGTMGFYYRNTSDILPNLIVNPVDFVGGASVGLLDPVCAPIGALGGNVGTCGAVAGTYNMLYVDDIDVYGLSLSKSIGGVSVGMDLNYRENMPLSSVTAVVSGGLLALAAPGAPGFVGGFSDDAVAKGKTFHWVVNALATFGDTPLWDSANLLTEIAGVHLVDVTKNENLYKGASWYRGADKATTNTWTFAANFTPTYYQVLPGVDLTLPMSYNVGLSGQGAVQLGGNEDAGSYSVGIGADVYQQYKFDLKYVDNFGPFDTCETGFDGAAPGAAGDYACTPGQATSFAGTPPQLKDRGMVTFTFKTTI